MTLTRLWSSLLALMATAMLAGLYMLAAGTDEGFSEADKSAVEAVTNAGTAALHAEIESSSVTLGPSLLQDTRLRATVAATSAGPAPEGSPSLQETLDEVANETLLQDHPLMSVAFIDKQSALVAKTGMAAELFDQLIVLDDLRNSTGEVRFSATLGDKLHAVQVSRAADSSGRRLVAIQAVNLGGNSLLRRVLGTYPAGIVRDGQVVGDPMGNAKPDDLVRLVTENIKEVPPSDASKVFTLGEGPNQRIGSISRVPGPAGKGAKPSYLAVLSLNSLGVVDRDLASALKSAQATGMGKVPWPLVGGFFVIALAFAIYLPHMESVAPMRRLAAEFNGIVEGSQHQVFHDTYSGELRNVARAAVNAQEAVRIQVEDEYANLGTDDGQGGYAAPAAVDEGPSAPAYSPSASDTSAADSDPGAIELPSMEGPGQLESHSHSAPEPPPPSDPLEQEAPAGLGSFADDSAGISADLGFGGADPGDMGGTPFNAPADDAGSLLADEPSGPPADPKEAYFREVFDEFVALKQTCGEDTSKFGYDKFAAKLRKNTASLLKKDGVVDVKFNVYIKDGKAALKAKVIKA